MNFARRQILTLLLVVLSGVAACLFAWSQQGTQYNAALAEVQARELRHSQQILDRFFVQAQEFLNRAVRDPRLQEMLRNGQGAEVVHELAESRNSIGFGAVELHDRSGEMLYLSDAPSRPEEWYGTKEFVQRQYTENMLPAAEVELRGKPTLIFAHPIRQEGSAIGVLMISFTLDEVLLQQLSDLTANALRMRFTDGRELATGAAGEHRALNWPNGADMKTVLEVQLPAALPGSTSSMLLWAFLGLAVLLGLSAMYNYWQHVTQQQNEFQSFLQTLHSGPQLDTQLAAAAAKKDNIGKLAAAMQGVLHHHNDQRHMMSAQIEQLHKTNESLLEQMQHAQRERDSALHAPRIKSEFLSRMGDEITTPMSSMMGMLQLLTEHHLPREEKELLLVAVRSARLLTDNLNNILDFAKLDAHMLQLRKQAFIVREMVESVIANVDHLAQEKKLKLSRNIQLDVPEQIINDELRVRQVLANLVGNAVRFTKEGEVGIYVDVWEKGGHKLLRFTVSDSGMGISKEAQVGLFDSFDSRSRLNNASFAGRLRLIVCRQLCELMGGEIGVSSEPGKGSRFWFTVSA